MDPICKRRGQYRLHAGYVYQDVNVYQYCLDKY